MPRFFAVAASVLNERRSSEARLFRFPEVADLRLPFAADPLRPSAEGAAPRGKTSDVLDVARWCYREISVIPRSRLATPCFRTMARALPPGLGLAVPPWV